MSEIKSKSDADREIKRGVKEIMQGGSSYHAIAASRKREEILQRKTPASKPHDKCDNDSKANARLIYLFMVSLFLVIMVIVGIFVSLGQTIFI